MLKKFTMASLAEVDGGRIAGALDREVARCHDDCHERASVGKPRRVALIVELTPVLDDRDEFASVDVQFKIKAAVLPPRESRSFNMIDADDGQLVVNELSPDNARQLTLPEGDKKRDPLKKVSP